MSTVNVDEMKGYQPPIDLNGRAVLAVQDVKQLERSVMIKFVVSDYLTHNKETAAPEVASQAVGREITAFITTDFSRAKGSYSRDMNYAFCAGIGVSPISWDTDDIIGKTVEAVVYTKLVDGLKEDVIKGYCAVS